MKKSICHLALYTCLLISLSACKYPFDLELCLQEKAHFYQNGSGKFEVTLDLEKARKVIALVEYIAQGYIRFVKLIIANSFLSTSRSLQYISGISQIKVSHGPDMLFFSLSFQFRDTQALNKAMNALYLNVDPPQTVYFKMKNSIFIRKDTAGLIRLAHYYRNVDDSATKSFDLDFFLRNMQYTVQYSFDQSLRQVSNPLASIGTDQRSVTLVHYPFKKEKKSSSISNKIVFNTSIIK
jgi:hypothetical protein